MYIKYEIAEQLNRCNFDYIDELDKITVDKIEIYFKLKSDWTGDNVMKIDKIYLDGYLLVTTRVSIRKEVNHPWYYLALKYGNCTIYKALNKIGDK